VLACIASPSPSIGSPFLWAPSDRRAFALRCGIRNSAPQYPAVPCRRDSHATSFALCRTLRQTIAEWRGECDHAFSHPSAPRQTCYIAGHAVALRALGSLLAKDTAQIETHFALANLWMARKMLWRPTKTEGASSRCSDCRQDATGSRLRSAQDDAIFTLSVPVRTPNQKTGCSDLPLLARKWSANHFNDCKRCV
jgi:hypothetical protein